MKLASTKFEALAYCEEAAASFYQSELQHLFDHCQVGISL